VALNLRSIRRITASGTNRIERTLKYASIRSNLATPEAGSLFCFRNFEPGWRFSLMAASRNRSCLTISSLSSSAAVCDADQIQSFHLNQISGTIVVSTINIKAKG
jgi:hypothetical protein